MTDLESRLKQIIPQDRSMGDLNHSSKILECLELLEKENSGSFVYGAGGKQLSEKPRCLFFCGLNFKTLKELLNTAPYKTGEHPNGVQYQMYEIPEDNHPITEAILGVTNPCDRYYRIFIQTEDGIVNCNVGVYFETYLRAA